MTNFKEFIDYVLSFYGAGQIYDQQRTKEQISYATLIYLDRMADNKNPDYKYYRYWSWGGGDSLDRERVRDIMNEVYNDSLEPSR
tara:strand:+ start:306 stop:560 length:255 start_codon:yes stop_codon:yes gene_type:complete